ncbi:hypothetical protein [Nostoc sp. TCL26-01]|uniref:hypothetical protein n=1 Tax=Nostoc sp. TCL26-01 TaxID=2576904 RepID=UPI0015B88B43|nr:hypothetical protein [Nostoc sp. TCL26-01]QLE57349.1 hypothetical protein FD725_18580 [Nostoc sp. TCL26-01]
MIVTERLNIESTYKTNNTFFGEYYTMANIKINNLQPGEVELVELSNLELEGILGGCVISTIIETVVGWVRDGINIGDVNIKLSWNDGPFITVTYRY